MQADEEAFWKFLSNFEVQSGMPVDITLEVDESRTWSFTYSSGSMILGE
jgi:hypothetical protein